MELLEGDSRSRWMQALSATDRLRDKYGDKAVFLAGGMASNVRERVHENPAERKSKKPEQG
jgi:hypothetical protein